MIRNETEVRRLLDGLAADPLLAASIEHLRSAPLALRVDPAAGGLDLALAGPGDDAARARARMKLFAPRNGTLVVFFYKRSLLAFSRDRFSLGALVMKRTFEAAVVDRALAYLDSGLAPPARPAGLSRTFPFTVPD